MICEECQKAGVKSRVTSLGGATTAMYCPPFYDEEGVHHHHDANTTTTTYQCSNGHRWTTSGHPKCPACNWPKEGTEA